jgi:hypothetical protein
VDFGTRPRRGVLHFRVFKKRKTEEQTKMAFIYGRSSKMNHFRQTAVAFWNLGQFLLLFAGQKEVKKSFFVTFLMGKKVTKKPTPCIQKSVPTSPKMVQKPLTPVFDFHFSLGSTTIFE